MPSVIAAIDYLKHLQKKGRGNAIVHIIDIEEEARKRKENPGPNPKTRFQIELDDPQAYCEWNAEKDRIVKRVGNKSVATTLMVRAWREALTDQEIDKIMAELDAIDSGVPKAEMPTWTE